jgi:hypothetical protein
MIYLGYDSHLYLNEEEYREISQEQQKEITDFRLKLFKFSEKIEYDETFK